MSASQDKKRRQAERADGVDKRSLAECEAARKAKKERTRWGIVGAIIVVFAVVVILLNTNLFYSGTTAITIGDYKYTNADFQYYYSNAYANFMNSYGSYFSSMTTTAKTTIIAPTMPQRVRSFLAFWAASRSARVRLSVPSMRSV